MATSEAPTDSNWRARRPAKAKPCIPQLNCELCRERKIKCDKSSPCSNCTKAHVQCVPIYRRRLPRGRHTHRQSPVAINEEEEDDDDLRHRIRRLEALVTSMSSPEDSPAPAASLVAALKSGQPTAGSSQIADIAASKQAGQQFWARITEEIDGLRGIVDSPSDDEESTRPISKSAADSGTRLIGIGSLHGDSPGVAHVCPRDTQVAAQLCQVYLRQVDPIVKILHRPSLKKFMLSGQRYLGHEPDDISTACLRDAVCYSAVASMTEGQCQAMFNGNKSAAMTRYRAASDTSLEAAQLLTTSDITVLQAFVLYLIARRTEASSRAIWTLVAVAVRISKALSLHLGKEETFFSQQIRQRLWYTICVLDLQASFEQGSEPLIELDPKSSALPKNINDSEFDVDSTDEVQDRDGLTDMTFALVTYSAQLSGRLLNFYGKEADTLDWEDREKHVSRFEQNALNLLKFCDPESSPYAWFAFHGTQSLVATMRLSALRPLHRVGGRPTPRNHLPADLLDVALKVLDKVHLIRTDPRGEGFRWYVVIQWHALAIAITECYVCADVGILRMAWPVVEAAFEYHMTVTETYRQGIFRKPLERLMVQARKRVGPLLRGQNHQPQPPSQSNLELSWGSVGGEQSGCPSNTRSSSSIAATELDSPNQTCLPTNQLQPHMPLTPLDLNCGGASPCFAFDNPIAGPSAIPSWFAPHMPFNPNSETSNTMDVSSNNTGDAAWRTWEEFVSGLSFDEFPHMAA